MEDQNSQVIDLDNLKMIGCKWVFALKHNPDGSFARYKARVVVEGFTQTYGIDYQDTLLLQRSPMSKLLSLLLPLSSETSSIRCQECISSLQPKKRSLYVTTSRLY